MDDLLQRMLTIDREAEKLVQAAELEASKTAEETRLQMRQEREAAQAALLAESDKLLQEQIEQCKIDADAELQATDQELKTKQKDFAESISTKREKLLLTLMALQ
jgi:hypothetical protein